MPASADTPPELALPAFDVRALARRAAVPALVAAVVAVALVLAGGPLRAFADALVLAAPAGDQERRTRAPEGASRSGRARTAVRNTQIALGTAIRDAIGLVRSGDVRLLGAPAWWAFDAAVLWAMLQAFGAPPPLAVIVLGYFVGQIANTIPIPGAVSGGMVGVLLAFGVEADLALVSVLAYRATAIWLPTPIGLAALGALRRTIARWAQEDAPATPTPESTPSGRQAPRPRRVAPCPEPAVQVAA